MGEKVARLACYTMVYFVMHAKTLYKNFLFIHWVLLLMWTSLPISASLDKTAEHNSINTYLSAIHTEITALRDNENPPKETIHLVLGNQSADMDSIVSAITFAYSNADKGFYVPVINSPREELPLRGDVQHVFETLHIKPDSLLYQDDLPFLLKLAMQGHIRLTLVDHNLLAHDQKAFENYVERVIDHHKDEQVVYPLMIEGETVIAKAGSNSTLIAEGILASNPDRMSPQVAYLLLSAILLDTKDLKNPAVTTERDIAIANLLKDRAEDYYTATLYALLMQSRNAVSHLTPDLLLKKDYKTYKEGNFFYGIAGIPKGTLWTAENRTQWKSAFEKALKKKKLHLLSALIYEDGVFIVYIPDGELQTAFLSHLQETPALNEQLILKDYFPDEGLFFFDLTTPLQRKQLQPLFLFKESLNIQDAIP